MVENDLLPWKVFFILLRKLIKNERQDTVRRIGCFLFSFLLSLSLFPLGAHAEEHVDALFPAYVYEGVLREETAGIPLGTRVRLYEAESGKSYVIGGRKGGGRVRVPWDAIEPIAKPSPVLPDVSERDITLYAGAHCLSKTDFLLWVDLSRTRLYVLEYADEGWALLASLPCAVGDAAHPTPSGRFEICYKSASIGKEDLYLCRYALCFYGGYMLHSVLFDWAGNEIIDGRTGVRISHGCIRLRHEDSKWLYESIPIGTTVFIR